MGTVRNFKRLFCDFICFKVRKHVKQKNVSGVWLVRDYHPALRWTALKWGCLMAFTLAAPLPSVFLGVACAFRKQYVYMTGIKLDCSLNDCVLS